MRQYLIQLLHHFIRELRRTSTPKLSIVVILGIIELLIIVYGLSNFVINPTDPNTFPTSAFAALFWLCSCFLTIVFATRLRPFFRRPSWSFLKLALPTLVISETLLESSIKTAAHATTNHTLSIMPTFNNLMIGIAASLWEEVGRLGITVLSPLYPLHDLVFALSHDVQTPGLLLQKLLHSMLFTAVLIKSKSLWNAVLIHMFVNIWSFGIWFSNLSGYQLSTLFLGYMFLVYTIFRVWRLPKEANIYT